MNCRALLPLAALLALSACNRPVPAPAPDTPPEPQATALREAMQQPLEKAEAARAAVEQAADARAAQADATDASAAPDAR